jgi:hypothetical protein
MPMTYHRDDMRRLIVVTLDRDMDMNEVYEAFYRQRREETWSYAVLVDMRRVVNTASLYDLRRFSRRSIESGPPAEERGRVAVVATHSVVYAVACAYAVLSRRGHTLRVFRDKSEAMDWFASSRPHTIVNAESTA